MACEVLTREFKNTKGEPVLVATRQLSATKALELHIEIIGKMGTCVFPLIDNKFSFGDIIAVMRANEHPAIHDLMKRVICNAVIEGKEIKPHNFDLHFDGELMMACQIFAFVLEANFHDFFKLGLEMNEQRRLAEEEASKLALQKNSSPKT